MFTRNVLSTGRVMLTSDAVLTWVGRVHRPEYPVYMAYHLVDRVLSCWQDACHVTKTIIAVDKVWWCQQDILPCWQVMMPVDKTLPCWNGMYFADACDIVASASVGDVSLTRMQASAASLQRSLNLSANKYYYYYCNCSHRDQRDKGWVVFSNTG